MFLWGSSWHDIKADDRSLLRDTTSVDCLPLVAGARYDRLPNIIANCVGEYRTLIGFLLMLNRPKVTEFVFQPRGHGWIGNRNRPLFAHRTVHVPLDATQTINLEPIEADITLRRRRHRVEGHFCHDRTAHNAMREHGCIHAWIPADEDWTPYAEPYPPVDERNHWLCQACGGKRWFKRQHERGDASLGYVLHRQYAVTG